MEITTTPRRGPMARLGSLVSSLLMLALLVVSVGYLVPSFLGYERYIITGGSMSGTYEKGSIVFEEVVPSEELEVGDVITYLPPASAGTTDLVTHRIISEREGRNGRQVFRTQGDANADPDPWKFTLDGTTQPRVAWSVPHAGWVFLFLADPRHRMWVIGGPAAAVALLSLIQAARGARDVRATARPTSTSGTVAHPDPDAVPVPAVARQLEPAV